MNRDKLNEIFKRSFSLVNLPSKGEFYDDKKSSIKIRYLSGLEERVLTDYFLTETGEGLHLVLKNLILEDEFDPRDLITPDLQGLMIFLYSTSYGDKIPFKVECQNHACKYENEIDIQLSQLKFKETDQKPIEGFFKFYLPFNKRFNTNEHEVETVRDSDTKEKYVEINIKPLTFGDEIELNKEGDKSRLKRVIMSIKSIGGIDDEDYISGVVKRMNLKEFGSIKNFVKDNEIGVEDVISLECPSCGHHNKSKLNLGYDFLKLPESYKESIMEESFLISHYGKDGSTDMDNLSLAVAERRWKIQRIKDELEKKREAEQKAVNQAKSSKSKGI